MFEGTFGYRRRVLELLNQIITNQEKIMATGKTGLQQLQAFQSAFDAYVTQNNTDMANLTTAINNAIAALGTSEDPAVQAIVSDLNAGLSAISANEANLENLTGSLNSADAPPVGSSAQKASAASPGGALGTAAPPLPKS